MKPSGNTFVSGEHTGLEYLKSVQGNFHRSPMAELFGMMIEKVEDGVAEVSAIPAEKFYNPMNRIHGGFAATVIDTALGCAVMTKLAKGIGYGTVDLNVNYVKKIDVDVGKLLCRANVLHAGRTLFTAEAKLVDANNVLYAHGTGTFLVYPQ